MPIDWMQKFQKNLEDEKVRKQGMADDYRKQRIQEYGQLGTQIQDILTQGQVADKGTGSMRPLSPEEKTQLKTTQEHVNQYLQKLHDQNIDPFSGSLHEDPLHRLTDKMRLTKPPEQKGQKAPEIEKEAGEARTQFGPTPAGAGAEKRQETERNVVQARSLLEKYMPPGPARDQAISQITERMISGTAGVKPKKMQRVVVRDPNDPQRRIPALQDMETGQVFGSEGEIDHPEVVSASALKLKQGWQKIGGKIIGVMLDPTTGQIIPGSENPNILPPAAYLEKIQEGFVGFTDEDNNFVLVPKVTRTKPNVPETGGGIGTTMGAKGEGGKTAAAKKGAGVAKVGTPDSAGKHLPPGSIVVGTKRASGQTLSRGDAARSIQPLIDQVEQMLKDPEVANNLGVIAGRWDQLEQRAGNLSGKLRELAGTLISIYSLGGAMHGWRSAQVPEKFSHTYGDLTATPDSLLGGLRAMRNTANTVESIAYPGHKKEAGPAGKGKGTEDDPIVIP